MYINQLHFSISYNFFFYVFDKELLHFAPLNQDWTLRTVHLSIRESNQGVICTHTKTLLQDICV